MFAAVCEEGQVDDESCNGSDGCQPVVCYGGEHTDQHNAKKFLLCL